MQDRRARRAGNRGGAIGVLDRTASAVDCLVAAIYPPVKLAALVACASCPSGAVSVASNPARRSTARPQGVRQDAARIWPARPRNPTGRASAATGSSPRCARGPTRSSSRRGTTPRPMGRSCRSATFLLGSVRPRHGSGALRHALGHASGLGRGPGLGATADPDTRRERRCVRVWRCSWSWATC